MAHSEAHLGELRNQLRARLKSLLAVASDVDSTLKDVNQVQNELDVEGKPINLLKGRLDRSYDRLGSDATREIAFVDDALQTLDELYTAQLPIVEAEPIASSRNAQSAGPVNKKRQRDSPSVAPPVPALVTTPSPVSSPGPLTRRPSARGRRETASAMQLPLAEGRPVAFKLPGRSGQGKEDWILAKVVNMVGTDKTRYTVQDVDYDPKSSAPEGGVYNTTIKSIVPLPDPRDRQRTYPDVEFAPGTPVMALYPDTTSFYRAVVQGGPSPEKGKRKERLYQVKFDDDDEVVRAVPIEHVADIQ